MLTCSLEASSSLPLPLLTVPAITPSVLSRIGFKSNKHFSYSLFNNSAFPFRYTKCYSNFDPTTSSSSSLDTDTDTDTDTVSDDDNDSDMDFKIEKLGNNCRRIYSKIRIDAPLQTVWNILTDYERLSDFIPGLLLSQLLYKTDTHARLFQVGQQNLAFGFKFNAKGILDCYENDLQTLPFGFKRVIKFKMIEGDFQLFEGEWSIYQIDKGGCQDGGNLQDEEIHTTLSYWVDVKPKPWLPVQLVEGRICDEIKMNLKCIREEAHKLVQLPAN